MYEVLWVDRRTFNVTPEHRTDLDTAYRDGTMRGLVKAMYTTYLNHEYKNSSIAVRILARILIRLNNPDKLDPNFCLGAGFRSNIGLDGTLVAYFLTCSVTSHFVEPKSVVVVDDGEFARLL
jgi:hypothetical protein